jgi:hypothetical protein
VGTSEAAIATNRHNPVDIVGTQIGVSFGPSLRGTKILAAGRPKDSTSQLNDVAHGMGFHCPKVTFYHSLIPPADTYSLMIVPQSRTHNRPNTGIHARRIASGSKNSYFFHDLIVFLVWYESKCKANTK